MAFINATTAAPASTGTSTTIGYASTTANDVCLLYVQVAATSPTVTTPTGWTPVNNIANGTTQALYCFRRVMAGNETGTLAVSWSATGTVAIAMLAYRYADTTTPVVTSATGTAAASTTHTAPALSGTVTSAAFAVYAVADVQSTSAQTRSGNPSVSGYALRAQVFGTVTTFPSLLVWDIIDASATSTTSAASTVTVTNSAASTGMQVAVKQAAPTSVSTADFASYTPGTALDARVGGAGSPAVSLPPIIGQLWPRGS